jgi:hypothetical protein
MKKIAFGLLLVFAFGFQLANAQDETMDITDVGIAKFNKDTMWTSAEQPTLILVPFESKMYKSQIDRSIGMNDGTNYQQIVNNWRVALDNIMFIQLDPNYKVIRLLANDEGREKDLSAMYGSSRLEYRVIPEEKKDDEKKKFKIPTKSKIKKEETTNNGTRIENGQLKSETDGQERFMACQVQDSAIFDYMHNKYGSVLYVLINQFDLGPMKGLDYRAFESDEYQRQITVHYSIYTHKHEIYSGISTNYFSSTMNSQKDIIIEALPQVAKQIAVHIPIVLSGKSVSISE